MRKGAENTGDRAVEQEERFETVTLHGTLFLYVRRAAHLGQSAARSAPGEEEEKRKRAKMRGKLTAGARFVGKKMLNAVRATNTVRFSALLLMTLTAPSIVNLGLYRLPCPY